MTKHAYERSGGSVEWATVSDSGSVHVRMTARPTQGFYVREDDSHRGVNASYPQICYNGGSRGNTLVWANNDDTAKHFARDIRATLHPNREAYVQALLAERADRATLPSWSAAHGGRDPVPAPQEDKQTRTAEISR